jgi:hypothetical protein
MGNFQVPPMLIPAAANRNRKNGLNFECESIFTKKLAGGH